MFDTMTMTKIIGGFCGTFLVFLLGKFAADIIYDVDAGSFAHGEGHEQSYIIEVESAEAAVEETDVSFDELLASADAGKGEKVYGKCKACHKLEDGANSTGPTLYGVVGRDIASVPGFNYDEALLSLQGTQWTPDHLQQFLESPKNYAPGTKMTFAGLKKIEDRANLVAYLQTIGQ
ncbi:MAG: c-type cytochrome [Marinosulfonomonas sp.]